MVRTPFAPYRQPCRRRSHFRAFPRDIATRVRSLRHRPSRSPGSQRAGTCWGLNANGQLGDGSTTNSPSPTTVAGSISWVTVVAGGSSTGSHTCGIVQSGDSYCWGANTAGQVGDTTTTSRTSPERVTGSLTWQAISVGASHTCAITTGLVPNCWGKNEVGQLGTGSSAVRALPADIGGRLSWTTLTVGDRHACGLVGSGIAYCWGDNASGQIGDASTTSRRLPTRVSGGLLWKSISAGYAHTCGITLSGIAYCWGANLEGQVGDGTLSSTRPSPTLVAGLLSWATISAGTSHTCGTTTANVAYCWGANGDGQLGDGTTISKTAPVAVSPMSGEPSPPVGGQMDTASLATDPLFPGPRRPQSLSQASLVSHFGRQFPQVGLTRAG
ncbi:MAG: hypothetical protein EBT47_00465 [Chloroflexi bacterium]|nr:hypothetical protein [Chloroflexota bacterium]